MVFVVKNTGISDQTQSFPVVLVSDIFFSINIFRSDWF